MAGRAGWSFWVWVGFLWCVLGYLFEGWLVLFLDGMDEDDKYDLVFLVIRCCYFCLSFSGG